MIFIQQQINLWLEVVFLNELVIVHYQIETHL